MTKKLLSLLLALSLIFSLAACGGSSKDEDEDDDRDVSTSDDEDTRDKDKDEDEDKDEDQDTDKDQSPHIGNGKNVGDDVGPAEDQEPPQEPVQEPDPPEDEDPGEVPAPDPAPAQDTEFPNFESSVVIDNDECSVTFTSVENDSLWGFTLNMLLENKSEDKTYTFTVDTGSVNGVKATPILFTDVLPGKKARDDVNISSSYFNDNDIGDYTDISLTIRVFESGNYSDPPVANETVHAYPYGQDKAQKYVRETLPGDVVLVDNDYVTAIATGYKMDDIWGWTAEFYLVNKSDKTITFRNDDGSINGYMYTPLFINTLEPGECAFDDMSWPTSVLEENEIDVVDNVEFTLTARDASSWDGELYAEVPVTLYTQEHAG